MLVIVIAIIGMVFGITISLRLNYSSHCVPLTL